jgi:hypothetical protein
MSETSWDENAEKASKPDKNGKSMKRKVETVRLFFFHLPKTREKKGRSQINGKGN